MTTPVFDHFSALMERAGTTRGQQRVNLYALAMQRAVPAMQEIANMQAPDCVKLVFGMNYTDEGSFLVLDTHEDVHGKATQLSDADIDVLDQIVFVLTGEGETGAGIPGMRRLDSDHYEVDLLAPAEDIAPAEENQKYTFTGIFHPSQPGLQRIRAAVDIPRHNVKAGDFGGFIQSEDNLEDVGDCWVADPAFVSDGAKVSEDALVRGHAQISGLARIQGDGVVNGGVIY